ncbi:hypothetical protein V2J09_005908 [Rumex salicifolius]
MLSKYSLSRGGGEASSELDMEELDATMMEGDVGYNPPGDPPDRTAAWADKVADGGLGGMPIPEKVLNDDFVAARIEVRFPKGVDGEPEIVIGQEILEAMAGLWKNCMKLRELWRPNGGMNVLDLPGRFFMVCFNVKIEYSNALTRGPWKIFGNHILVQTWDRHFDRHFDPLLDEIVTTPVWVHLSNISMIYYHRMILMRIAEGIGKPLRVDMATLKFERGRFARACIEVNLSKPLKGSITINGVRYFISYEGLNTICSHCGIHGHLIANCPKKVVNGDRGQEHAALGIGAEEGNKSSQNVEEEMDLETTIMEPTGNNVVGSQFLPQTPSRRSRRVSTFLLCQRKS